MTSVSTVLTESVAIAQYVADRVPARNLAPPNGTLERTKLQSWLNFLSSEIHMGGFCPLFYAGMPAEAKQIFRERLAGRLTHLDQRLAKNEYLMGISFSLADIYLFVATNWARSVKLDLSPYPNLLALRKRVAARSAVQTTMRSEVSLPSRDAASSGPPLAYEVHSPRSRAKLVVIRELLEQAAQDFDQGAAPLRRLIA